MKLWRVVCAVGVLALAGACKDSTNPLVGTGQAVSLSFMGTTPPIPSAPVMSVMADSMIVTSSDTNKLVITSVEVVVRQIELHRASMSTSCDSAAVDDCGEFKLGTMLQSLPLGTGTALALSVPIDSGTYDKVEFKIHKPGTDSVDALFTAANPTWPVNTSIRVRGTYNGTPFTYTSPIDLEQESVLSPPLVVNASGTSTNVTLRMDVSTWFKSGTAVIDPSTANVGQPNESLVNENIKNSMKAFKDADRDGRESNG